MRKGIAFCCAVLTLGLATAAAAATLAVSADKGTYVVGETITLTLTGTSTSGETASDVYAAVGYSAALTETVSASQTPLTTSFGTDWTTGVLQTNDGEVALLNQFALGGTPNGSGVSHATATLVAEAVGMVTVTFLEVTSFGGSLDYFGITLPSQTTGTSFTIVPEPSVAALIGLGLVGLALGAGRAR